MMQGTEGNDSVNRDLNGSAADSSPLVLDFFTAEFAVTRAVSSASTASTSAVSASVRRPRLSASTR